jgi:hypothetical protein
LIKQRGPHENPKPTINHRTGQNKFRTVARAAAGRRAARKSRAILSGYRRVSIKNVAALGVAPRGGAGSNGRRAARERTAGAVRRIG